MSAAQVARPSSDGDVAVRRPIAGSRRVLGRSAGGAVAGPSRSGTLAGPSLAATPAIPRPVRRAQNAVTIRRPAEDVRTSGTFEGVFYEWAFPAGSIYSFLSF
jgi:hypothetical protein